MNSFTTKHQKIEAQLTRIFLPILLISLLIVSSTAHAACTEEDVPLGSGVVSTGTSIDKSIVNQNANDVTGGW